MSLKARLAKLEADARAADPSSYPPLHLPPQEVDWPVQEDMAERVMADPGVTDDELRAMARTGDPAAEPGPVENAVAEARDTAAYLLAERAARVARTGT